jgi:hypothetical protein
MKTFCHEPIKPARRETIGEQVFLRHWQALMGSSPSDTSDYAQPTWLEQILYNLYEIITQRHATVAASLITWLGTNYGRSLISAARAHEALAPSTCSEFAWLAAWSVVNRRARGTNSGVRILEHVLAPLDSLSPQGQLLEIPQLSAEDFEVAEHLCMWLGTPQGKNFIAGAEQELQRLKEAAHYPCGRIEPATGLKGVVAVWNTPDHSRDREELCIGGDTFGGWAPTATGDFEAYVDRSGRRNSVTFADLDEAKRWVESSVQVFVNRLSTAV